MVTFCLCWNNLLFVKLQFYTSTSILIVLHFKPKLDKFWSSIWIITDEDGGDLQTPKQELARKSLISDISVMYLEWLGLISEKSHCMDLNQPIFYTQREHDLIEYAIFQPSQIGKGNRNLFFQPPDSA